MTCRLECPANAEEQLVRALAGKSDPAVVLDGIVEKAFKDCSDRVRALGREPDVDLLERASWIYEPKSRLQHERPELVGTAMAIRTPTHTYVHRRYESDEFYDRLADPEETTNLIGRADDLELQHELLAMLLGWLADTSDVIPWEKHPRRPKIPHGYRTAAPG